MESQTKDDRERMKSVMFLMREYLDITRIRMLETCTLLHHDIIRSRPLHCDLKVPHRSAPLEQGSPDCS